jgi:hypothetical protein
MNKQTKDLNSTLSCQVCEIIGLINYSCRNLQPVLYKKVHKDVDENRHKDKTPYQFFFAILGKLLCCKNEINLKQDEKNT